MLLTPSDSDFRLACPFKAQKQLAQRKDQKVLIERLLNQVNRAWDCQHNSVACLMERPSLRSTVQSFLRSLASKSGEFDIKCSLNKLRRQDIPTRLLRQSGIHELDQEEEEEDDDDYILFENPLQRTVDYFKKMKINDPLFECSGFCLNFSLVQKERKRSSIGSIFSNFTRRIWKDKRQSERNCNFTLVVANDEKLRPMLQNLRRIMLLTRQPFQLYEHEAGEKENIQTNRLSTSSTIDTFSQNPFAIKTSLDATIKSHSGKKSKANVSIIDDSEGFLSARSERKELQENLTHLSKSYSERKKPSPYKPPTLRSHTKRMKQTAREMDLLQELNGLLNQNEEACRQGIEEAREVQMLNKISDFNHHERLSRRGFF